jgi:hypothetical protein
MTHLSNAAEISSTPPGANMINKIKRGSNTPDHPQQFHQHQGVLPVSSLPNSKSRSKTILLALPLPVILIFTCMTFVVNADKPSARRQLVPLVILQSSERILEDVPFISALAPASSRDDKEIYFLRRDRSNIAIYDGERRRSKEVVSFGRDPKALAIGTQGRVYVASESEVRVIDPTGRSLGSFPIPNPTSLAVSANGDVVVSSPDSGKLLHVFDQAGLPLRMIGEQKRFDIRNLSQNSFLNRGKVLMGPSGILYYVSIFAPTPTVQKFSSQGELLLEFAVEGNAVDLQLEHAKEFLVTKNAETVGGFHVITSAATDPVTGHLWVGMNGSSTHGTVTPGSGVLYEYDSDGQKLAEYGLLLNSPLAATGIITDVRDITVNTPWIHVLTSQSQVYRFNMNDRLEGANGQRKMEFKGTLASFARGFWSEASAPAPMVLPQTSCPAAQEFTCVANCPANSSPLTQDCAAEIKRHLTTGDRIISDSCTINQASPGGCSGNATSCNTGTGVQVSYSVSLNCNPAPTPNPVARECFGGEFVACPGNGVRDPVTCRCSNPDSPIVIDAEGNGFSLTDAANGVNFDLDNNGTKERLGWTAAGSDDAFLVLDRNGNGTIDNGAELFGNFTPQSEPPAGEERNGFLALAEFDKPENGGDADGLIRKTDAIFSSLRLWQDTNHNGISESSELHTLKQLGLKTLHLDYKESKRTDQYGNQFRYRAKVKDNQDAQLGRWAWDVFLVSHP